MGHGIRTRLAGVVKLFRIDRYAAWRVRAAVAGVDGTSRS
jgi:hypothetical protein